MDFDLFEAEDDYILSSMCITETEQIDAPNNALPEFNCQGEDTINMPFNSDSLAANFAIFDSSFESKDEILLTEYNFNKSSLYSAMKTNLIIGQARMHIQKLIVSSKFPLENDGLTFYQSRQQVTLLYHLINSSPDIDKAILKSHLKSLRNLIDGCTTIEFFKTIYIASSCKGNDTDSAAYHLLHGFLEWRILDLIILKKQHYDLNMQLGEDSYENVSVFFEQYSRVLDDFIQILICFFKKKSLPDLMFQSPFPCTCIKEAWLVMQFIIEKLKDEKYSFWKLVNEKLECIRIDSERYELNASKVPEFILWLLKGLVRLQGYKSNGIYEGPSHSRITENYDLLEPTVDQFLKSNPNEEHTRIFLCNLMPIILEWWPAKPNIPMLLWEYFHKKLNSQFFIAGSAPSNLAISSSSGKGYLDKIKTLLTHSTPDANLSSFTLFYLILGKTIERLLKSHQSNQVQKIFGRIYTKFSAAKFLALSEIGLHHLVELFLVLAVSADVAEIVPKLKDNLLTIQLDKISTNRQVCVAKGHVALMMLHSENFMDLSEYIRKLLEQLHAIKNDINVCRILAEGLCEILQKTENFDGGEHLLIDSWLTHYLNNSIPVEQERTLEAIHSLFEKIQHPHRSQANVFGINAVPSTSSASSSSSSSLLTSNAILRTNNFQNIIKNLNLHIYPFIKQNFGTSFSIWMPKLAADFCILYQHNSSAASSASSTSSSASNATTKFSTSNASSGKSPCNNAAASTNSDNGMFQKNFQFFADAACSNKEAPLNFLLAILASDKSGLIPPSTIMQIWLKSLVLLSSNNEGVANLTRAVSHLDEFRQLSDLSDSDLLAAKEPLCLFVSAVGRTYKNCENFQEKCRLSDKFNRYVQHFDKWCCDKNEKQKVMLRFYSFIAIVIFNCSEIVYARSKINCFFHIAMTRFILPTAVQMGKPPDSKLTQVVHKIWPVLVQGIGSLNFKNDPYISKTLTDLIVKWTPHFKISQNSKIVARPFLNCLTPDNEALSIFVFEKLTTVFLTMQRRQADPNACLVITIFQEVVDANSSDEIKLKLFLKATCLTTLEHLMMVEQIVPSRAMLLDMFKKICKSTAFQNCSDIRELIMEHIRIITVKHLSYYTFFYFDLLTQIVNICVELIEPILEFLLEQIKIVEQKRGGGEDQRIRACYQKLKGSIIAAKYK